MSAAPTLTEILRDVAKQADVEGRPFTAEMRAAVVAILAVPEDDRGFVMAWFCRGCGRYHGPGDWCACENDE